jgi:hypothetical protein
MLLGFWFGILLQASRKSRRGTQECVRHIDGQKQAG